LTNAEKAGWSIIDIYSYYSYYIEIKRGFFTSFIYSSFIDCLFQNMDFLDGFIIIFSFALPIFGIVLVKNSKNKYR